MHAVSSAGGLFPHAKRAPCADATPLPTAVGLDDAWQACGSYGPLNYTYHAADGTPQVNLDKFPSLSAMTAHAHALNLTAGCACVGALPLLRVLLSSIVHSHAPRPHRACPSLPAHQSMATIACAMITARMCCALLVRAPAARWSRSLASRRIGLAQTPPSPSPPAAEVNFVIDMGFDRCVGVRHADCLHGSSPPWSPLL